MNESALTPPTAVHTIPGVAPSSKLLRPLLIVAATAILAAAVLGCSFSASLTVNMDVEPPPGTQQTEAAP